MQVSMMTKKNLKYILDAAMVSNPKEVTDDSPNVPMTSTLVLKTSARKSLCHFTNILNVKKKTVKRCVGASKSKHRSVKVVNSLCTHLKKRKGNSKADEHIIRNLYAWITRHTQVSQSPISNDCLKVIFDDHI